MSGNPTTGPRADGHRRRLGSVHYDRLLALDHWSSDDCANYLGIATKTWTAYVARKLAPPPTGWDPHTGRRIWNATEVATWDDTRPARPGRPRHDLETQQGEGPS